MVDNIIPYIGGEEEKSEIEPLKIWGHIEGDKIVDANGPAITTQCLRVPASDGHMAAVFVSFENKPTIEEIKQAWKDFSGVPQELNLPHAPKQFLHYFEEPDRPQTKSTEILRAVWLYQSVVCARIHSTIINLSAFHITPSEARQAEQFLWQSCSRQKDILNANY